MSATVDLTQGNEIRLQDVIAEINSKGIGVTASINTTGDGLLLTDAAGGTQKLKVDNVEGTTASDLNIKGTATATTIDGSFEKTITVNATDTLQTLQTKINDLNWGVTASIINDGSSIAPYRLSLNAKNSGRDGRVVFDAGATTLDTRTLVEYVTAGFATTAPGGDTAEYYVSLAPQTVPTATALPVTNGTASVSGTLPSDKLAIYSVPLGTGLNTVRLAMPSVYATGAFIVLRDDELAVDSRETNGPASALVGDVAPTTLTRIVVDQAFTLLPTAASFSFWILTTCSATSLVPEPG